MRYSVTPRHGCFSLFYASALGGGHFGIARSVHLSVPWRSCLGYSHAGCLQLSHRRPPDMCGLRIRPPADVDPPRFLLPSNCHRRGHIVSPPPGRYLVQYRLLGSEIFLGCKIGLVGLFVCLFVLQIHSTATHRDIINDLEQRG